jgi:hypothetical protein
MDKKIIEDQLVAVISDSQKIIRTDIETQEMHGKKSSSISKYATDQVVTRISACIERITGKNSVYYQRIDEIRNAQFQLDIASRMIRVAKALLDDVRSGYLTSLIEIVHADLFSNFIDMASYLVKQGYKDAAGVITGSALEVHLKNLCIKNNILVEETKNDGSVKPKKANQMNQDLCSAKVYGQLDQKSVTAWLELRNNSAHGKYNEYDAKQVEFYIDNIREFIRRYPA